MKLENAGFITSGFKVARALLLIVLGSAFMVGGCSEIEERQKKIEKLKEDQGRKIERSRKAIAETNETMREIEKDIREQREVIELVKEDLESCRAEKRELRRKLDLCEQAGNH